MDPRHLRTYLFCVFFLLDSSWAFAGKAVPLPQAAPIETHMNLGLFGLLGGSMEYTHDGKKITQYGDFKKIIYPLRDERASQMIREAESDHFTAMMIYGAGLASGLDIALFFKPTPIFRVDWMDRVATGVVAAQVFIGLGALFDLNAEGHKYNAVQRYNRLTRQTGGISWELGPDWSAQDRLVGLTAAGRF